jgi:hypothetical protein
MLIKIFRRNYYCKDCGSSNIIPHNGWVYEKVCLDELSNLSQLITNFTPDMVN